MKKLLITAVLILTYAHSSLYAQDKNTLSDQAEAWLITVGPGKEIYQLWGHSTLRIKDDINKIDRVYNFGVVPMGDPEWAGNFILGNLWYQVDSYSYPVFYAGYTYMDRSLRQIKLNLDRAEIQTLYDFMNWRVQPGNNIYLYLFFHDNCSTRIRDLPKKLENAEINFADWDKDITFRELFAPYLKNNSWKRFGLEFMLNSMVDQKLDLYTAAGLPDYLEMLFSRSVISDENGTRPLAGSKPEYLNSVNVEANPPDFWYSPLLVFSIVFAIAILLRFKKRNMKAFDFILFFIAGLLGGLLFFLWVFTNHIYGHHNWNMLWAMPLHIFGAFLVFGKGSVKKWYFRINAAVLALIPVFLIFITQRMPLAAFPLIMTLLFRSIDNGELFRPIIGFTGRIIAKVRRNKASG